MVPNAKKKKFNTCVHPYAKSKKRAELNPKKGKKSSSSRKKTKQPKKKE